MANNRTYYGTAEFAVNFEPTGQFPLDARLVVDNMTMLLDADTYGKKKDGLVLNNFYEGMPVIVKTGDSGKTELWVLRDATKRTVREGWQRLDADASQINDALSKILKYEVEKVDTGLPANVEARYQVVSYVGTKTDDNKTKVGEFIDIPKDGQLQNVEVTNNASGEPTVIKFTYVLDGGKIKDVSIDLGKAIFESEMGNGMQVVDNKIAIKLDAANEGDFLTVGANGVKLSGVQNAIDAAIQRLDATEVAEAGKYINTVKQENGVISATLKQVKGTEVALDSISDGGSITIDTTNVQTAVKDLFDKMIDDEQVTAASINAIKSTFGINGEELKYEPQVDDVNIGGATSYSDADAKLSAAITATKNDVDTKINNLNVSDNAADGQFVTTVSQTNGKITVGRDVINANKVVLAKVKEDVTNGVELAATDVQGGVKELFDKMLSNEKVAAESINKIKGIFGIKGETLTYEPSTNEIIKDATSFIDADDKLAAAIKAKGDTINSLILSNVGGDGKFIKSISQDAGLVSAVAADLNAAAVSLTQVGENGDSATAVKLSATTVQAGLQELFDKILENEEIDANAINKVKTILGIIGEELKYVPQTGNGIIDTAISYNDADKKLAEAIKSLQEINIIDVGEY